MPVKAENLTWEDYAAVGAGAVTGAAIGTMVADGPGAVVGAGIGALLGLWAANIGQDKQAAFLESQARTDYAHSLKNTTDNYLGLAHASATNQLSLYNTSNMFFIRKAEWGALQLYQSQAENGTSHAWDSQYVLTVSDVANGTLATTWAISEQYQAILNQYVSLTDTFTGTYDGMNWGYKSIESDKLTVSFQTQDPYRITKVGYTWDPSSTAFVTLSHGSPIMIYNANAAERSVTLTATDRYGNATTQAMTVKAYQAFTWAPEKSGDYKITLSTSTDWKLFGIAGEPAINPVTLTPCIVSGAKVNDNEVKIDFFVTSQDSVIYFQIHTDPTCYCSLKNIYTDLETAKEAAQQMQGTALNFAQAYYNTLVSDGGGDNRILPDVVFPDPEALKNLTAEQAYAIYLAYLTQQQDWFKNYSVMNPSNVNISAESLSLKLLGSIYYANGTVMYPSGTVFTPYISTADMVLKAGQRNDMTQPGFAIVWGTATDLDSAGKMTNIKYVPLAVGDYFIIDEMQRDGQDVTEETLKVTTVQYAVYDQFKPITPPQGVGDAEWLMAHWYWFVLIAGAIILLAWIPTRNTAVGILGLILLLVGAAGWILSDASTTTGLLSGLFRVR